MDASVVVLFSGGADSALTVLLADATVIGHGKVVALFVDYGQPSAAIERAYAERFAARHRIRIECVSFPVHGLSALDVASDSPVIPGRNALLLSAAVNLAASIGAEHVCFGATGGDYAEFPDCRPAFIGAYDALVKASGLSVSVSAPLLEMTKREVMEELRTFGITEDATWSCYGRGPAACGECMSCLERESAAL